MLESELQQQIRAEASRAGCVLWRNNVGAFDGVRYGLANDSRAMNQLHKSADLVGIEPVLITPGMVGSVVGRFLAREVKRPGWHYTGTEREQAQLRWLERVSLMGGNAGFACGLGTIEAAR